jgi:hypothetical protein
MANRWPPWIEASIAKSANQDFTTNVATKITDLELAITPKIAARVHCTWVLDLQDTGAGADLFIADMYLDGVVSRLGGVWSMAAGNRSPFVFVGTADIAAAATVTVQLFGRCNTGGLTTLRVGSGRSYLNVICLPLDGISY